MFSEASQTEWREPFHLFMETVSTYDLGTDRLLRPRKVWCMKTVPP